MGPQHTFNSPHLFPTLTFPCISPYLPHTPSHFPTPLFIPLPTSPLPPPHPNTFSYYPYITLHFLKVWRRYHVMKFLWRSYHEAKLLATSPIPLSTFFPHMPTRFLTHPIHSPTPSPHIFPYLPPHPNTFPYISPHTSLPTAPLTSPYTPTHFLIHPKHSPTFLPHVTPQFRLCGEVTMCRCYLNEFNSKSPIKFFYGNQKFKVLFRCRPYKFSIYESVAKLPCGKVTGNHCE